MSFLLSRADMLDLNTEAALPILLKGVMDVHLSDQSTEYYLIRLAGWCDTEHHRHLLLGAEFGGGDAFAQVLQLFVRRNGFSLDAMRIKMGVLKVGDPGPPAVQGLLAQTDHDGGARGHHDLSRIFG